MKIKRIELEKHFEFLGIEDMEDYVALLASNKFFCPPDDIMGVCDTQCIQCWEKFLNNNIED